MAMNGDDPALLMAGIEALEKKYAALEQEAAADKEEAAAAKQEAAAAKEGLAERSLLALKTSGIVFVDRTATIPHCALDTHARSKLKSTVVKLQAFPDKVWGAPYTLPVEKKGVSVDSEAMVVSRVVEIIQALIVGLGLQELVQVATHRTVAGVELDVVLLFGQNERLCLLGNK